MMQAKEFLAPNQPLKISAVPLYRLLDPYGYHFYTTNEAEKNATIKDLSYQEEGIIGYAFAQQVEGTVPLYRYSGELTYVTNVQKDEIVNIARHFYTTDQNEKELKFEKTYINVSHGDNFNPRYVEHYVSEGIQCYVSPINVAGTAPVFWLHQYSYGIVDEGDHGKLHPGSFDNFYTSNEEEKFSAVFKYKYSDKGISFYVWNAAIKI